MAEQFPSVNCAPKSKCHLPTVIFAAVPATLLSFPAALAILFGGTMSLALNPAAFAMLLCGVLGWCGMIALWTAARSSGRVTKWTARGLVGGIVSVLIYYGFEIFTDGQSMRQWSFTPLVTIGPLLFSIHYLRRYRNQPPPLVTKSTGGSARPFDEVRMGRVLVLLWIVPLIIELGFIPALPGKPAGLGTIGIVVLSFPFYLGLAVTAAWCFRRSRRLRPLAAATFLTPVLLPFALYWMEKWIGHAEIQSISKYVAIAIPILLLVLMPKRVAGYLPRFVINSPGFAKAWTALLSLMLIPWVILAILFGVLQEAQNKGAFAFLIWYSGTSIVVALTTLIMVYIGIRAQEHPQKWLRFTQVVLSLLLLLLAIPAVIIILLMFGLAGLG